MLLAKARTAAGAEAEATTLQKQQQKYSYREIHVQKVNSENGIWLLYYVQGFAWWVVG